MATKKPYSRHTNSADRRKDEGAPVPSGQPIVKPDYKKGTTVPGGQPVTQPSPKTSPSADTQPSVNPKPPTVNQPTSDSPNPKPEGTESAK